MCALSGAVTAAAGPFDYFTQGDWGELYTSGTRQSPINIRTEDVLGGGRTKDLVFTDWHYWVDGSVENNGHSVQFTPFWIGSVKITTHLGEYKLLQMHMHWGENNEVGSEHRINGNQASLELHFVHERVASSGPDSEKYAVVGVMAEAGSESQTSPFSRLPVSTIQNYKWKTTTFLSPEWFLPSDRSYYYYEGSLTTPPCSEFVQWFVMKERIVVPRSFLENLRKVKTSSGTKLQFNYRDLQPIKCRSVFDHDDPGQCPRTVSPLKLGTIPSGEQPAVLKPRTGDESSRSETK